MFACKSQGELISGEYYRGDEYITDVKVINIFPDIYFYEKNSFLNQVGVNLVPTIFMDTLQNIKLLFVILTPDFKNIFDGVANNLCISKASSK